jgi:hypothetical protein
MISSVIICLATFAVLVWWLRRNKVSLGIPVAYLFSLLFLHVPGAIAHMVGGEYLYDTKATEIGIRYTAIGTVAFTVGVIVVGSFAGARQRKNSAQLTSVGLHRFAVFCLLAGLLVTYTLRLFVSIPSIGAIIETGGGIWVLGVLLGLQSAMRRGDGGQITSWLAAMGVYPLLTLLLGGFLSFGATPVFIILSGLVISTRSSWRVGIGLPVVALVFFTMFLSYFNNRDQIRDAVWSGAAMGERVRESTRIFSDLEFFDSQNQRHLEALDRRLNQNFFVGMADQRIKSGEVNYKNGQTFVDGLISLIPRIIWPAKPVFAGSPDIIREMTGFIINDATSYGVGNVMEFHINFGMPSLILGFLFLGMLLGWCDRHACIRVQRGDWGSAIVFFMPGAAMIHPNGSLVELVSGGASAFIAALFWKRLWNHWSYFSNFDTSSRIKRSRRLGESSAFNSQ